MGSYVVVFRDHRGEWHGVCHSPRWELAVTAFGTTARTLTAIDYYDDTGPDLLKIIDGEGAGQAYYEQAPALACE